MVFQTVFVQSCGTVTVKMFCFFFKGEEIGLLIFKSSAKKWLWLFKVTVGDEDALFCVCVLSGCLKGQENSLQTGAANCTECGLCVCRKKSWYFYTGTKGSNIGINSDSESFIDPRIGNSVYSYQSTPPLQYITFTITRALARMVVCIFKFLLFYNPLSCCHKLPVWSPAQVKQWSW